jgi:hypothetical protein
MSADGLRRVYVVELSTGAFVRSLNRRSSPTGLPCVYVGQSWHFPAARLAIHRSGALHGSGWVRDFGVRLRPELYVDVQPTQDLAQAERSERALAVALREVGFTAISDGRAFRPSGTDVNPVTELSATVEEILDELALQLAARTGDPSPNAIATLLTQIPAPGDACRGRFAHVKPSVVRTRCRWLSKRGYLTTAAGVESAPNPAEEA